MKSEPAAKSSDVDAKAQPAAVYVGWSTFRNLVMNGMADAGLPHRIDKSAFPGQAGGVQSQLMAGMKFLGLVDDRGAPTPALHDLTAQEESARKEALARVLRDSYPALFALGLEKVTMSHLAETMASAYNVSGDTKERAIRFFLGAAQYAGIAISKWLKAKPAASPARKRRRTNGDAPGASPDDDPPNAGTGVTHGSVPSLTRQITLSKGETLTLTLVGDPFKMNADDRAFAFGLVDAMAKRTPDEDDEAEGDAAP